MQYDMLGVICETRRGFYQATRPTPTMTVSLYGMILNTTGSAKDFGVHNQTGQNPEPLFLSPQEKEMRREGSGVKRGGVWFQKSKKSYFASPGFPLSNFQR